jgi:hypothetical protein
MKDDAKAVSEVIGYVVVVSVVLIAIGLVFVNVIPVLGDTEQAEQTKNAQRVFSVLQENVEEITRKGVPSRNTEIRLGDGRLTAMRDTSVINVTIETDVAGGTTVERSIGTRHLTYETEAGVISYENGAVFRRDTQGNAAMLEEPNWRVKEDGAVILPMVSLGGRTEAVSGGIATIVTTESTNIAQFRLDNANATESTEVELEMESPNADAWKRYAKDLEGAEVASSSDGEVTILIDDIDDRALIYTEVFIGVRITK